VKRKLSSRALYAIVVGGLALYAAAFWFLLASPKRSKADELKVQAAELQVTVANARRAATAPPDSEPIAVADVFRLAKAMPSAPDMPGILLELARIADETGIEFQSITPQSAKVEGEYQVVPIALVFDGNFYELSDLLFRLRTLVGVRQGRLDATGRLFAVETLNFAESPNGFPEITAAVTLNAYVYGTDTSGSAVPAEQPPAEAPAQSSEPAPAPGAEAAPAEAP
jgi:type IV pilus assembly protein PilO